jgi:fumarylacetoacetate (FAA) hydrolase
MDLPEERGEEAIGGYFVLDDWSARDLQRDESTLRLGPAKGKDFGVSVGPWLVTPDELADRRTPGATGPDLTMVATVRTHDGREVETTRGTWSSAYYAFGQLVARASADVRLRPGEILGSGTVGGGCLLEIRDETLGRYLSLETSSPSRSSAGPAGDTGGRPHVVNAIDESAAAG